MRKGGGGGPIRKGEGGGPAVRKGGGGGPAVRAQAETMQRMAATSQVVVLAPLLPVQDPDTRGQICTALGSLAYAASC